MNRRHFLALASGLLAPVPEPVKRYFFAPAGGWRGVTLTGNWTRTLATIDGYRETITVKRYDVGRATTIDMFDFVNGPHGMYLSAEFRRGPWGARESAEFEQGIEDKFGALTEALARASKG